MKNRAFNSFLTPDSTVQCEYSELNSIENTINVDISTTSYNDSENKKTSKAK